MKKIYLFAVIVLFTVSTQAQNVGIGTNDPKTKLDINGGLSLREGPVLTLANGGASAGANDNISLPDITTGVKAAFYRIAGPTAAFSVFGIQPITGADGQLVTLVNTTSQVMTIKNNASSVAANGFKTLTGSDMVSVAGNSSITIQYNKTESRWYVTGSQNYAVTTGSIATGDITTGNSAITLTNNTGRLVGTGTMTVDVQNNELNKKGLVPGPTGGNGNQVWGTDVSGNPAWQKVSNSQLTNSSITVNNGTGVSVSGSPVALGGTITVTNTAPDQTIVLNNGTGISATGTYPNFTITNTGDLSNTNEAQTISGAGTNDISLSQVSGSGGGTITLNGTGSTTVTRSGNTFTINSTTGGGTVTAVTASNGLNSTGGATPDIKLGGTLSSATTIAQAGNNVMFTGTGNVGIGTASPTAKLHVGGHSILSTLNQGYNATQRFYPNVISDAVDNNVTGAWIIHTPIARASTEMFTIHVHGYGYGTADVIDFTISGYAYSGVNGNIDGVAGAITNTKLSDVGTDGWSKYVGIDASGKVAIAFGDIGNTAYFYRISVDAWVSRYGTDVSTGWSIDRNTTANFNWLDKTGPMTSSIKGAIAINSAGAVGITGLAAGSAVYTDGSGNLTTSIPNSSTLGYWTRNNASGYLYNTTLTDKIGLGTNTPVAKLELEGPAADWNETTPGTAVGSIHLDPGTGTTNYGSAITWGASDNSNGDNGQAGIYVRSSGGYGTKMYFGTTDAYVTGAKTRMMLDANGNVGIGTTAPVHKLDVNGNIKTSGHLIQGALVAKPYVTWSAAGGTTGAVIIKLPGTVANYGMLHMQIDVYEYGSTGVTTYFVGGHNWSSQWYNYNCNTVGNSTKKVRLGVKDNQYCVVLGDNTSTWSYGHVVLSTITNGGYYSGTIDLGGTYTAYQDAAAESYTWISADLNKTVTTANGTTDYIPKFTSATTFGNSQIYDNGTSIGIGTASPGSYKLNVQQGSAVSLFQSTNDAQIELKGTDAWGGIKWTDVGGTDYSWFYGATGTWSFGGGGSAVSGKKMHIHGGTTIGAGFAGSSSPANGLGIEGSLGVGVASPTAKLHVAGGGAIIGTTSSGSVNRTLTVLGDNTTQISFGSYPYDWSPAIQIQNNDNTKMTWISAGGSGAYSAYNARYLTNGSGLDFYTGSNAFAATITSGGFVGIGTGSPGYKLQVYGASGAYPAQVGSPDGYLAFGPANTGWCHFQTDRPSFYFNPKVTVDGNVEPYNSNSNDLGTSGRTWRTLYIGPTNANFNGSNGGSLELGADNSVNGTGTPYIDFHSSSGAADYHHRIIAQNNYRLDFYTNYTSTYSGLNVSIDVTTGRAAVADVSLWTNYYTRYGGYYDIINDLDSIDNIRPIKWHNFKTGKMETAMDVSTLPLNTKMVDENGNYLTDGANMLAFNTGAIRQLRAETKSRDEGMDARLSRLENLVSQLTGKQLGELEFKAHATAYKGIEAFVIMDARISAKSTIQIEGLGGYEIVNQGEGSFGIKFSSPPSADVKFSYSAKF